MVKVNMLVKEDEKNACGHQVFCEGFTGRIHILVGHSS